jgi:hypothetical protein
MDGMLRRVSYLLMGTGIALFLIGMGAAFISSLNLYWITVGGWAVGMIGALVYASDVFRMLKRKEERGPF